MSRPPAIAPPPHCPHCDKDLPTVELYNWAFTSWVILAVFCSHCRKVLHWQVVPVAVPAEDPRVQIPS